MKTVEYRVRPVARYIVTEYQSDTDGFGSVGTIGEFDNEEHAQRVCNVMTSHHEIEKTMWRGPSEFGSD